MIETFFCILNLYYCLTTGRFYLQTFGFGILRNLHASVGTPNALTRNSGNGDWTTDRHRWLLNIFSSTILISTFSFPIISSNSVLPNDSCRSARNHHFNGVNFSNDVPYVIKQYQCTALQLLPSILYSIAVISLRIMPTFISIACK